MCLTALAEPSPGSEDVFQLESHVDITTSVVVITVSDCASVTGGEDVFRTGSGEMREVQRPTMVGGRAREVVNQLFRLGALDPRDIGYCSDYTSPIHPRPSIGGVRRQRMSG